MVFKLSKTGFNAATFTDNDNKLLFDDKTGVFLKTNKLSLKVVFIPVISTFPSPSISPAIMLDTLIFFANKTGAAKLFDQLTVDMFLNTAKPFPVSVFTISNLPSPSISATPTTALLAPVVKFCKVPINKPVLSL